MKFMFGLQHPLTCKPWTTLSNLTNKVRGKYNCKEVFLRLPSCVFIMRRLFMRLSLMLCPCDAEWWCRWLYNIVRFGAVTRIWDQSMVLFRVLKFLQGIMEGPLCWEDKKCIRMVPWCTHVKMANHAKLVREI